MKFSKAVFWVAGVWGLLIITPLYFLFDVIGKTDPPQITHPGFYYGFVGTAFAWQIAFLIIAQDPLRFRPLIPACVIEKITYVTATVVLVIQGRMHPADLTFAVTDGLLGIFFVVSYYKLKPLVR